MRQRQLWAEGSFTAFLRKLILIYFINDLVVFLGYGAIVSN